MRCLLLFAASIALLASSSESGFAQKKKLNYTPTKAYRQVEIEGFTVLLHPNADPEKSKDDRATVLLERIREQATLMARVIPKDPLRVMQSAKIWVDNDLEGIRKRSEKFKRDLAGQYIPEDAKAIRMAGEMNPDKASGVLLDLNVSLMGGSALLLHEMGHAFHFKAFADRPAVKAAYDQAMERKLYDSVSMATWISRSGSLAAEVHPKLQKAYAATNEHEYFAELTVAYFSQSGYYPHTWTALRSHDPQGFKLMQTAYGTPDRDTRKVKLTIENTMPAEATIVHLGPKGNQTKGKIPPHGRLELKTVAGERFDAVFASPARKVIFVVPAKDEATFEVAYRRDDDVVVPPGAIPSVADLAVTSISKTGTDVSVLIDNKGPEFYTPLEGIRMCRFTAMDAKGKTIATEEMLANALPKGIGRVAFWQRCPADAASIRVELVPRGNDPNASNDSKTFKIPKK